MNLVLISSEEFELSSRVTLTGRRADHIRGVLKLAAGDTFRIGIVNGRMGQARIVSDTSAGIEVEFACDDLPPREVDIRLVMGLPRPKVARRVVSAIASMGVKDVAFVGGYRVDKAYWNSPLLSENTLREACLLGLEQSRDTMLPRITLHRTFKPFVEDVLPDFAAGSRRLLLHPGVGDVCPSGVDDVLTVAIGPDGGWTDYEVERFQSMGFERMHLGRRILRVETAVPAILGRLLSF